MENARAVSGALCMPASRRIDVLHGMRLSIRDYRVSPSEQVRKYVRCHDHRDRYSPSASERGESLHALAEMPSLLRCIHGYSKRDRYTPQIATPRMQRRCRFLLFSDPKKLLQADTRQKKNLILNINMYLTNSPSFHFHLFHSTQNSVRPN